MDRRDGDVKIDLVLELEAKCGQPHFIALTDAIRSGADLIGDHFGEMLTVPIASILRSVSIETGLDFEVLSL